MAHAENTVTIDRSAEDVYAYLADGTNNRRWRSGVLEIERVTGDGGVGTTYHQVLQGPGGRKIDGDYTVTEASEPRTFGFEVVAGPVRPVGRFELAHVGPGTTQVKFSLDVEPKGLMRLMGGMVTKQMRAEVGHLADLKRELET